MQQRPRSPAVARHEPETIALAWKEWREIVRDRLFGLAFIVPTMLMLIFGFWPEPGRGEPALRGGGP